jgi:Mlc titration factor MtfA (ptsG expression regulator)
MQLQNFFRENLSSIIFSVALILYAFVSIRKVLKQKDADVVNQPDQPVSKPGRLVYYGNQLKLADDEIAHILSRYHPYYINLEAELQNRFRKRLTEFMRQKIFVIHAKEGYKEMPVLTSAAAIQISFGLDKFMLPWFNIIQIHTEEYFDESFLKVLNGDVEGNTVTIAWNQFLKGNIDQSDGENVGIHEMAHALYYQNVVVENKEEVFKALFKEVLRQGEKIYELRSRQQLLFNDYAYKNLQEFWAESVEMFFEKPDSMQIAFNDLFIILKQLLRQNPLNKLNPLPEKYSV